MIRFNVLGTVELYGPDGAELRSVLVQPKRVALLAFLALNRPPGFQRRESVMAMLWPESDTGRARGSLRNALHNLRLQVAEDVILSRGAAEIAIDSARLDCDAVRFERLVEQGEPEAALALYHGHLLAGFQLAGVPEFDYWLDRRRDQLHALAVSAATTLAERAIEPAVALKWAMRAVELEPFAEPAARRMLELYVRAGDPAGALRAFEIWSARLRSELESEPSASTVALVQQIRAESALAAELVPPSVPVSKRRLHAAPLVLPTPLMRRPYGAVAAVTLAAVIFLVALTSMRGREILPSSTLRIGARETADAVLVHLATAMLARAPNAHVLAAGARDADAIIAHAGSELRLELRDGSNVVLTGEGEYEVAAAIAAELARRFGLQLPPDTIGWHSPSAAAVTAAVLGESAYRDGRFDAAVEYYSQAIALDSGYAQAWFGQARAGNWLDYSVMAHALSGATQRSRRLPLDDRPLIEGWTGLIGGRPERALAIFEAHVQRYPSEAEPWFMLGEVRYHWGSTIGIARADARAAFDSAAVRAQPHAGALLHALRLAAVDGSAAQADSLAELVLATGLPLREKVEARALAAVRAGDEQRITAALAELQTLSAPDRADLLSMLVLAARDPLFSAELPNQLLHASDPEHLRARAQLMRVRMLQRAGRFAEAASAIDLIARRAPHRAAEERAIQAAFLFQPADAQTLLRARRDLLRAPALPAGDGTWNVSSVHINAVPAPHRRFYLAMLSLLAGDPAQARLDIDSLRAHRGTNINEALVAATGLQALSLLETLLQGNAEGAATQIAQQQGVSSYPDLSSTIAALERWLRAESYWRAGRDDEAMQWYGAMPDPGLSDAVYEAPSRLRRAELLEGAGRTAEAIAQYRRFIELWQHADPQLQEYVQQARARLARL